MSSKYRNGKGGGSCPWIALVLLLTSGVLLTAGCGSEDPKPAADSERQGAQEARTTDTRLAREFVERGNEICETGRRRKLQALVALGADPTLAEAERYALRSEAPNIERQVEEIAALKTPPELRAAVVQLVNVSQKSLDKLRARPALIEVLRELFAPTVSVALEMGLEACSG